jgi:hypothetical protein
MNTWQHYYDLAAAQYAVQLTTNMRLYPDEEKRAAVTRMAEEAKMFAEVFCKVADATPAKTYVTERGGPLDLPESGT